MPICFLMEESKQGCELSGRECEEDLGGVGRVGTIIKLYCLEKIYFQFLRSKMIKLYSV